jgi:hypothetical protein
MSNWQGSWRADVGINHTPAYQVSGRPFASASVNYDTTARVVYLPYVSRWFQVFNRGESDLRVGFSAAGVTAAKTTAPGDKYYLTVPPSSSSGFGKSDIYEMKVANIWLYGATAGTCDVVAGLTTIPRQRTSGTLGPNFSGSVGV